MHLCDNMYRALALLLLLPALCPAGEIVENFSYAGPKTTIKYALWGGANEVVYSRKICEAFVRKHPAVRLEVAVYPWGQYWAKLQTQAAAGLAPDVFSLYSGGAGVWFTHGALLPLDDLVKRSGMNLDDYHAAAVANCTWNGKLYCMPIELPVRTLVYSKTRLEQAGIPREEWPRLDKPLSWDEFKALCRKLMLRKPDGSFQDYAMTAGIDWNNTMIRMYGGSLMDRQVDPTRPMVINNEPLRRGITEIFEAQYGDRWTLGEAPLSSGAVVGMDTILVSSKFALGLTGPWGLEQLREAGVRFGLAPMPRGPVPSQLTGVNSVGIFVHSRESDAAWKFVTFMASSEIQPIFGKMLKGVPALRSASDALVHNDLGIEGCEAFLYDLPISAPAMMCGNSYVPAAAAKWFAETERVLDAEYDTRLRAAPRSNGKLADAEYAAFVDGMQAFVEKTVRERLPLLDNELQHAFARARTPAPGPAVRIVLPIVFVVLLAALSAGYIGWLIRRHEPDRVQRRRSTLTGYLFLSPWIAGCVFFVLCPIVAAVALSFMDWNMISMPRWVGVQNYTSLLGDDQFFIGLKCTLSYAALVIPISLVGGLFTAGLLTCDIRGRNAFKAILYFPSLFTGAATAVLWVNLFSKEYGVVNHALGFLGMAPINWLDVNHAFFTVILMNVFWVGGAMIIYYAAMKQIPRSLYEAAEVDGAGPVRKFFHITIPMLSPVILFMVIMTTIGAFQVFTPALFFARSSATIGEPGDALRFYSVNIYNEAFNNLRMGRACCYALLLFLLIFAVTMIQMKVSRRYVHTEDE